MKRWLWVGLVAVVLGVGFALIARRGVLGEGNLWSWLPGAFARRDSVTLVRVEAARDSLTSAITMVDSMFKARTRAQQAALAEAEREIARAQATSRRAQRAVDSLRALRRDDDDEDALQEENRALRNQVTAVTSERDAAYAMIRVLAADTLRLSQQLTQVNQQLAEAIRQREEYRNLKKRDWKAVALTATAVTLGCRAVAEPC